MLTIKYKQTGFTIVELLIVIVVIGILAAITVVAYSNIQAKAKEAKMSSDLESIEKAIMAARVNTGKTMYEITANTYTKVNCTNHPAGTNLAALPKADGCWTAYVSALEKISEASGMNVRELVDPWGRPYAFDENEGAPSGAGIDCREDTISAFANPLAGTSPYQGTLKSVPLSGFSACP